MIFSAYLILRLLAIDFADRIAQKTLAVAFSATSLSKRLIVDRSVQDQDDLQTD